MDFSRRAAVKSRIQNLRKVTVRTAIEVLKDINIIGIRIKELFSYRHMGMF